MLARWRNNGARFTTEDGRVVLPGHEFVADRWSRDVVMRLQKLELLHTVDRNRGTTYPEYPGVFFGSKAAYDRAREADPPLESEWFEGRAGTGQEDTWLVRDVRRLLDDRRLADGG